MPQTLIMGILNITPDSFSDGGKNLHAKTAIISAKKMIEQGANIIDIGGESTRPNAQKVTLTDEINRVIPVIETLASEVKTPISIDTSKPQLMKLAVAAGASLINDVNALRADGALSMAASLDADICLMHMQNSPQTMQNSPKYKDVVDDIKYFFERRINACERAGIATDRLILDPGFGFGKTLKHNVEILRRFDEFKTFKLRLLAGLSKKSMIGEILNNAEISHRVFGSLAGAIIAAQKGANIVRVHDVLATKDALSVLQAINGE